MTSALHLLRLAFMVVIAVLVVIHVCIGALVTGAFVWANWPWGQTPHPLDDASAEWPEGDAR